MSNVIRPMLASVVDWRYVRYPVWVSPKVDGLRCIVSGGVAYSRTWKPFRNRYLQALVRASADVLEGLDGELVVGSPFEGEVYQRTDSGIMSEMGSPEVQFLVFDQVLQPERPYMNRHDDMPAGELLPSWVSSLPQKEWGSRRGVEFYAADLLRQGYEGAILRDPFAAYKFGRSTTRGAALLKYKPYADAEAVIIGTQELMHNENAPRKDVQGVTRRSSHAAGKRGSGKLGALLCRTPAGAEFGIGTGFTDQVRTELWRERDSLPGRYVKYRYLPYGTLESTGVPRHPSFLGFRDQSDM